jgi:hypothetical protein
MPKLIEYGRDLSMACQKDFFEIAVCPNQIERQIRLGVETAAKWSKQGASVEIEARSRKWWKLRSN